MNIKKFNPPKIDGELTGALFTHADVWGVWENTHEVCLRNLEKNVFNSQYTVSS
jgi:hypothetical protein